MRRVTPDYQRRLVYVLPPSGYNLRRNHDPGVSDVTDSKNQEEFEK